MFRLPLAAFVVLVATDIFFLTAAGGLANAAERPNIHVDLPAGWEPKTSTLKNSLQSGRNDEVGAYFDLLADAKSDFSANVDLMAYAKRLIASGTRRSKLQNRTVTAPSEREIAGRKTIEYEVTGESNGLKLHYRYIVTEIGAYFCALECWTVPSHWDDAQPRFDDLVKSLH